MAKEAFTFEPHGPWIPLRGTGKHYCLGCGLISLANDPSRWAVEKGCNYKDHPSYKVKLKKGVR